MSEENFTVKITKSNPDDLVGVTFQKYPGKDRIFVREIKDKSPFRGSRLKPGHQVISINGCECSEMEVADVAALIRAANQDVAIVARECQSDMYSYTVAKENVHAPVGITMQQAHGKIYVHSIAETSPFRGSRLQVGDQVYSINDIPCDNMTAQSAADIIKAAQESVTIVAKERQSDIFTLTVKKETQATPMGLVVRRVNGQIFVHKITDTSPFRNTRLKVGHKVLSINDVPCNEMTANTAAAIMKAAQGTVSLTATEAKASVPTTSSGMSGKARPPPPGVKDGGAWGSGKYFGSNSGAFMTTSCIIGIFFLPACCVALVPCCFPMDNRDLYKLKGKFYTPDGKYIGTQENVGEFKLYA